MTATIEPPANSPDASLASVSSKAYKPIDYDMAFALRSKGFTYPEIAKELGCKVGTLHAWFSRKGLRVAVQASKAKVVSLTNARASEELKSTLASELDAQARAFTGVPVKYGELFNSKDGQGRISAIKTLAEAAKIVHGWGNEAGSVTFGLVMLSDAGQVVEQPAVDVESSAVVEPAKCDTTGQQDTTPQ